MMIFQRDLLIPALLLGLLSWGNLRADEAPVKGTRLQLELVDVGQSVSGSVGRCLCFHLITKTKGMAGHLETKEFILSSPGLIEYEVTRGTEFKLNNDIRGKMLKLGAVKLYWKGARLGLDFSGVEFKDDHLKGYSDMVRGAIDLYFAIYKSQYTSLELGVGYAYEKGKVNLYREFENANPTVKGRFIKRTKRHRFDFGMAYELVTTNLITEKKWSHRGLLEINYSYDFLDNRYLEMYFGTTVKAEADYFREDVLDLSPYGLGLHLTLGGRFKVKKR